MPNLENLKKQANQYLRWHRERYYPVAAQIRAVLPRFRHLADVQILESGFKLSECSGANRAAIGFRQLAGAQIRSRCHDRCAHTHDAMSHFPFSLGTTLRRGHQEFLRFLYEQARLRGRICLWPSTVLRAGHPRQCTTRLAAGPRTCLRRQCSQARTSSLCLNHGCHRERNQTAVSDLSGFRSLLPSATQERAMGCQNVYSLGSR